MVPHCQQSGASSFVKTLDELAYVSETPSKNVHVVSINQNQLLVLLDKEKLGEAVVVLLNISRNPHKRIQHSCYSVYNGVMMVRAELHLINYRCSLHT